MINSIAFLRAAARVKYAMPLRVRSLSRSISTAKYDDMVVWKGFLMDCRSSLRRWDLSVMEMGKDFEMVSLMLLWDWYAGWGFIPQVFTAMLEQCGKYYISWF